MSSPDFWKNREAADAKIKEHGVLSDLIAKCNAVDAGIKELEVSGAGMSGDDAGKVRTLDSMKINFMK